MALMMPNQRAVCPAVRAQARPSLVVGARRSALLLKPLGAARTVARCADERADCVYRAIISETDS